MMMTTVAIGITLAAHMWPEMGAKIHKELMTKGFFGERLATERLGWRDDENDSSVAFS
jgi:hypothetical protein